MLLTLLSSLLIGIVSGSLWRIAVMVALTALVIWSIRNTVVHYQGRQFLGRGALVLAVLAGFVASDAMRATAIPKLQAEIRVHKAAIEECSVARDEAQKRIEFLNQVAAQRNAAIAEAEKRAHDVEKIAGQTAQRTYRGTKAKAMIETKSVESLNSWFATEISEYNPKAG